MEVGRASWPVSRWALGDGPGGPSHIVCQGTGREARLTLCVRGRAGRPVSRWASVGRASWPVARWALGDGPGGPSHIVCQGTGREARPTSRWQHASSRD
jgi:hypothetical protein